MKRDPNAIDEIKDLEEAKYIIMMMTGNVYLHGNVYDLMPTKLDEENDDVDADMVMLPVGIDV